MELGDITPYFRFSLRSAIYLPKAMRFAKSKPASLYYLLLTGPHPQKPILLLYQSGTALSLYYVFVLNRTLATLY